MMYGIPSAIYKEGTQAQGFRDVGFFFIIPLFTGILEEWNIGILDKSVKFRDSGI
jgi:hypothetical protein